MGGNQSHSSGDRLEINVRENRRGNKQWTIQRHWQHCVHKTQNGDRQNKNKIQHRKLKR